MADTEQDLNTTLSAVRFERYAQDEKWGTDFTGRSEQEWLEIALEEIGEALREPAGSEARQVELIQCAAVFASWAQHCPTEVRQPMDDSVWERPPGPLMPTPIGVIMSNIGLAAQRRLEARFG